MLNNTKKGGRLTKVYDLGTAKSFDVKVLAPEVDYSSLTVDNFLIVGTAHIKTGSTSAQANRDLYGEATISKSYNASTGVLSCELDAHGCITGYYDPESGHWRGADTYGSTGVHIYLITNYKLED